MNHYNRQQWEKYKNRDMDSQESLLMEEHLVECDQCLALYLELFNRHDLVAANEHIPEKFSSTVLSIVKTGGQVSPPVLQTSRRKRARRRILAFYTAAAVITVMLTGSGVFTNLAQKAYAYQSLPVQQEQVQDPEGYGWPSIDVTNLIHTMKGGKK